VNSPMWSRIFFKLPATLMKARIRIRLWRIGIAAGMPRRCAPAALPTDTRATARWRDSSRAAAHQQKVSKRTACRCGIRSVPNSLRMTDVGNHRQQEGFTQTLYRRYHPPLGDTLKRVDVIHAFDAIEIGAVATLTFLPILHAPDPVRALALRSFRSPSRHDQPCSPAPLRSGA
jgi:hypothetical protein